MSDDDDDHLASFRALVTAMPELAKKKARQEGGGAGGGRPPSVAIFPFLSEQGADGQQSATPHPRVQKVPETFEELFPGVVVASPCGPISGNELLFQASNLPLFLKEAWPHLRKRNVLVTHRNFLAREVLARASAKGASAGRIPNAAVVHVTFEHLATGLKKEIFFVRHCTSHHNASRRGSGSMTTCADVSALRRLAATLRQIASEGEDGDVLYGSSVLPRAILSCLSLQRAVSDEELEKVRKAFASEATALPAEIAAYQEAHKCQPGAREGYCAGPKSTFILR